MPTLKDYLQEFGIKNNLIIDGYTLTEINGDHIQIARYRKYEYPLTLTFSPQFENSPEILISEFSKYTSGTRIIYTRYGNPYKCTFGNPEISSILPNGDVTISSTGHAYRI